MGPSPHGLPTPRVEERSGSLLSPTRESGLFVTLVENSYTGCVTLGKGLDLCVSYV